MTAYERPAHWSDDDVLKDLHARYHCQDGNLLGPNDCAWDRCEFWYAAKFVADTVGLANTGGETEWGIAYDIDSFATDYAPMSEADVRKAVAESPTDTGLIRRTVTPWVAVDPAGPETTERKS